MIKCVHVRNPAQAKKRGNIRLAGDEKYEREAEA